MDTALQGSTGAINGLDVLLWVAFFILASRFHAWAYRKPAARTDVAVPDYANPEAETPQLRLAG